VTQARVRFNPFGAEFRRDPYPLYRQLRETQPVHRTLGMWVLTRHADVQGVLRDRTFSAGLIPQLVGRRTEGLPPEDAARIARLGSASLVFTDNPDHARLRGLVNRAFTAQAVETLRPLVADVAGRLVRRAVERGGADAVADLAAPLPIAVLCGWMALPADVAGRVGPWTHDIRFLLEPGMMKVGDIAHVAEVVAEFSLALDGVVAQRRSRPGADLISRLLATETGNGDRLSDEEIVVVAIMCFVAGNETTTSLIGNGLLALLRHPEQAALLRERPELAAATVDEALRYDAPLQMTKRLATRDVEIGGQQIRIGDQVLLCLGAANRDPDVFADPDGFDITRDTTGHLGLGHGMHGCLGGLLARVQAQAVIGLLSAAGRMELASEDLECRDLEWQDLEWQDHSFIVRGLKRLPVALGTGA